MPELPEVETVKNKLKANILDCYIEQVSVYYEPTIDNIEANDFISSLEGQKICDIKRKGKWLIFQLSNFYLVSHLRMEGRYNFKTKKDEIEKHEHVVFQLSNGISLRYKDTRKFGRMQLYPINTPFDDLIKNIGLEPWDPNLNKFYLNDKFKNKSIAIKTTLLDQTIIAGIGNIYADEILFLSKINPLRKTNSLLEKDLINIIENTKKVLELAIQHGGSTIRTYEVVGGIHGNYQDFLNVHARKGKKCPNCETLIEKITVNGRGTYFCPKCQAK